MTPFVSRDPVQVAAAARAYGGLSVVFSLDRWGAIADDALVVYDGAPLAYVPVHLLPKIADAFPNSDTSELRRAVATYHAERAGQRGRA